MPVRDPGKTSVDPLQPFVPRRVEKPWGYELIWAENDLYVGKILHITGGHALSLQYHRVKDETIHVLSGNLALEVARPEQAPQELRLSQGESFRIVPGLRHRMIAIDDCDVLEASTPQLDDVVRLEDRYGRVASE
ncbi:MAG TPA: cupin domain-containing protein [Terriglobales bacterium]|nr:cupin domain-containing protein [Terriglobales bacterium]